jgi:hypothetical protein
LTHRKQGKAFFFEKKKQKAFVCAVADLVGKVRVSTRKSFLVLFLEKGLLARYESWSRPAGITGCDESDTYQCCPVDAANRRKQAVLLYKKRTKKPLFIRR